MKNIKIDKKYIKMVASVLKNQLKNDIFILIKTHNNNIVFEIAGASHSSTAYKITTSNHCPDNMEFSVMIDDIPVFYNMIKNGGDMIIKNIDNIKLYFNIGIGGLNSVIGTIDPGNFPFIEYPPTTTNFLKLKAQDIIDMQKHLKFSISTSEYQPTMQYYCIYPVLNSVFTTNSFCMSVLHTDIETDFVNPVTDIETDTVNPVDEVLVPPYLIDILKDFKTDIVFNLVSLTDDKIKKVVIKSDCFCAYYIYDDNFPDVKSIIPTEYPYSIILHTKTLLSAIKLLKQSKDKYDIMLNINIDGIVKLSIGDLSIDMEFLYCNIKEIMFNIIIFNKLLTSFSKLNTDDICSICLETQDENCAKLFHIRTIDNVKVDYYLMPLKR